MKIYRAGILILFVIAAGLFLLAQYNKQSAQDYASHYTAAVTTTTKNNPDSSTTRPATALLPDTSTDTVPIQKSTQVQQRYQAIAHTDQYPDIATRKDAMREHNPALNISDDDLIDLLQEPNAWRNLSEAPAGLPLSAEEQKDGREFIELNPHRWAILLPGDEIDLPVTGTGARYTMVIDKIEHQANNTTTWHGHLKNIDEPMLVSLTQGDGISLGGFDTPNGHYVVQANNNQGWVASSATLFKPNPDFPTDVLVPPTPSEHTPP